jgi:GH43 family beta-xylosidase
MSWETAIYRFAASFFRKSLAGGVKKQYLCHDKLDFTKTTIQMKRFCYLFLLFIGSCLAGVAATPSELMIADPFILLDNGTYYAYGTHSGQGIEVYTSDDLQTWYKRGLALHKSNTTETQNFWAPEVYKFGDKFYMYFSANEHLYVAQADSPLGPFKQIGTTSMLGDEKGIDSSVFTDEDGQSYCVFVRFTNGNCIWMAKLGADHATLDMSSLHLCAQASQTWEKVLGTVNEGPCIVKHNGHYYMMYSGNDYRSQDYGVGVATTDNITGTWTKYADNPILQKGEDLYGTAHNAYFYDKDGKMRIVFHAHYNSTTVSPRRIYIGTLTFSNDSLKMSAEPFIRPKVAEAPDDVETAYGMQYGTAVTADLNNDGYKDMVMGGFGRSTTTKTTPAGIQHTDDRFDAVRMYNPSRNTWKRMLTKINVADRPALIPCDINCDGNIDIVAFETVGIDTAAAAYKDKYGDEGIYLGTGTGLFTLQPMTFVDASGNALDFDVRAPLTADVADFNNDGLPDIVCAGYQKNLGTCNVVLLNRGNFVFQVLPYDETWHFESPIVEAYDFNNDGYTDFIISSKVNDNSSQSVFTELYQNIPDHPGTFKAMGLNANGVHRKANGALQVADLNNDGYLDFFLSGIGDSGDESANVQRVYLNKGTADAAFAADVRNTALTSDAIRPLNSVNSGAGLIDWNGDGSFDLFTTGWMPLMNTQTGYLYQNDGTGQLLQRNMIPGGSECAIAFPDYNGDGAKDYLNTGWAYDDTFVVGDSRGRVLTISDNPNAAPARPDAPVLVGATGKAGAVTLAWTPATTAQNNTTYEYFVKDGAGNFVTSCTSFVGGDDDGVRKVDHLGNAGCNRQITLNLPVGNYVWGVQAVNAAYDGSVFVKATMEVTAESVGIRAIQNGPAVERSRFSITGMPLLTPQRGVNLVKYSDGSVRKVIVK